MIIRTQVSEEAFAASVSIIRTGGQAIIDNQGVTLYITPAGFA